MFVFNKWFKKYFLFTLTMLFLSSLLLNACTPNAGEDAKEEEKIEQTEEQEPAKEEPAPDPEPEKEQPVKEEPKPEPPKEEAVIPKVDPAKWTEATQETILTLNMLAYELDEWIGKSVWVIGYYGDSSFTADGIGFLVLNYNSLLSDEQLEEHTFARLSGNLPAAKRRGDEIAVYGEIQDFSKAYPDKSSPSVPLIIIQKYIVQSDDVPSTSWDNPYSAMLNKISVVSIIDNIKGFFQTGNALAQGGERAPTQPNDGDRAIILSGGINDNNNHDRYRDNIRAKYEKLRSMGFTADQINVLYADGSTVNATDGGNQVDIVDKGASKVNVDSVITDTGRAMSPSSTLTIFVTDHGTGYNPKKGWSGARPALSGAEATNGALYNESTFKVDLTKKVFKRSMDIITNGKTFEMRKNDKGKVLIYMRIDGSWAYKGGDSNRDGYVSEKEIGEDLDGDGTLEDNSGWTVATLEGNMSTSFSHYNNSYDTDRDGTKDIKASWNGTAYNFTRLKSDGTWGLMGSDTNGDYIIDGVDWNLDGDKDDQIGFHEGINLWGNEVLWDDEFATQLQSLKDKGVHILVEMISCYSGGFIPNLEGIVDGIYTGSSEETPHWNRTNAADKVYAADEMAFLENLKGIDWDSWQEAAKSAISADEAAKGTGTTNAHQSSFFEKFETGSAMQAGENGNYTVMLNTGDIPKDVHDFEIILGYQDPRWLWAGFPNGVPSGMAQRLIPGGVRVQSDEPFPDSFVFRVKGDAGSTSLRIMLTDKEHKVIGYMDVGEGEIPEALITRWCPVVSVEEEEEESGVGGSGSSPPPCFAPDTWVMMADNTKKYIGDVEIGDLVKTYDTETGQIVTADVIETNFGTADYYYLINGNLKVTPPHPFFTAKGQWVKIMDLEIGDRIQSIQGLTEITSIQKVDAEQDIANISVRDYHSFFVSADGEDFYLASEGR